MGDRTPQPGKTLDQLIERQFEKRPELEASWDLTESRRELASALVGLRAAAGLTQAQVAEGAGWDQPYVSKMESAMGAWPTAGNLSKFAAVCNAGIGWVFLREQEETVVTVGRGFVTGTATIREGFQQLVGKLPIAEKKSGGS